MRARSVAKVVEHQGLTVHIDRARGTIREDVDKDGKPYSVVQQDDYGFFPGVKGDDGEDYDAYVGDSTKAPDVYIVTQLKATDGSYDEQKAMLGYDSPMAAEAAFRAHTAPMMFGRMGALSIDAFKAELQAWKGGDCAAPFNCPTRSIEPERAAATTGPSVASAALAGAPAPPPPPRSSDSTPSANETKDMTHGTQELPAAGAVPAPLAAAGTPVQQPEAPAASGADVWRQSGMCVRAAGLSAVREAEREVDFVCSTDAQDSYGEIVRQTWDLTRFNKNPVALWSHQSNELPIGHWKNVRVEDNALRGTLVLATAAANPKAEQVWNLILQKCLRAVSVGFRPHKISFEEVDGDEVCCLDNNELYEISPTPLPANPEAIIDQKARAKAAFNELRQRTSGTATAGRGLTPTPDVALSVIPYEALPAKDTGTWNASSAITRVRKWASSNGSASPDHIDWVKYRRAFAWMDPKLTHDFAGFKLLHHDIVDGELITSKGGVMAACAALAADPPTVKLPLNDVAAVKLHLAKHAHQFGMQAPWEAPKDDDKTTGTPSVTPQKKNRTAMAKKNEIECPKCGESFDPDDMDDDEKSKSCKAALDIFVQKRTSGITAERDQAVQKASQVEQKKTEIEGKVSQLDRDLKAEAAKSAQLATEKADLVTLTSGLQEQLVKAQLTPLSGIKFAPSQLEGEVDLAKHYLSQGAAGQTKWDNHLKNLNLAPNLTILGGSVIPADTTPSGLSTAGAGGPDDTGDLISMINKDAQTQS